MLRDSLRYASWRTAWSVWDTHPDSGRIRGMFVWHGRCSVGWSKLKNEQKSFAVQAGGNRVGMYSNRMSTVAASASGQVMVLICVSLIAIMGMIAVVTDFSFMQHQRNMMQTAADSAAMAGAEELNYGDLVAAGKADAASNGYTDGPAASPWRSTIHRARDRMRRTRRTSRRSSRKPAADIFSARARGQHDDRVGAGGGVRGQRARTAST